LDPFLKLGRPKKLLGKTETRTDSLAVVGTGPHKERAHSKFSASASERWFECPGSVELSEGLPDKSSSWAEEGTRAHEVLEKLLTHCLKSGIANPHVLSVDPTVSKEMWDYAVHAVDYIIAQAVIAGTSNVLAEQKVRLSFIHPEMFGTYDAAVVDYFGTLHVFDYKYGAGVYVSPIENLQMIFYGIGLAYKYDWNFKKVQLWIIQPRVKGYDGPMSWEVSIEDLKNYWTPLFEKAVKNVLENPKEFKEGAHCRWCKAQSVCPVKGEKRTEKAKSIFTSAPLKIK
jgi:hypothetical protein